METGILTRTSDVPPEMRGDRRLCFYAAIFDVPASVSENGENFVEVIRPGAFARAIASNCEVIANLEHDPRTTFAKRSTGLMLQEDARGLFCSVYLPKSAANDKVIEGVRTGKLNGCSFKFCDTPNGRRRTVTGGTTLHEVLDVELLDVCLSAGNAVYKQTAVSLRSLRTSANPLQIAELRIRRLRLGDQG